MASVAARLLLLLLLVDCVYPTTILLFEATLDGEDVLIVAIDRRATKPTVRPAKMSSKADAYSKAKATFDVYNGGGDKGKLAHKFGVTTHVLFTPCTIVLNAGAPEPKELELIEISAKKYYSNPNNRHLAFVAGPRRKELLNVVDEWIHSVQQ